MILNRIRYCFLCVLVILIGTTDIHAQLTDDATACLPMASVFALDAFGISAKHSFQERVVLAGTSGAIMSSFVYGLKYSVHRTRPDGSSHTSFPSFHSAVAFTGAHLLCKEYSHQSVWIPIAGCSIATVAASMRIVHDKHYFTDTLVGAGIGIASVELAYITLPFWRRVLNLPADKQFVLSPVVSNKQLGAYMSFTF